MYKKIISTLVIGTLLAGTLTGCGGSSDAGSSAKSSGKTELELFSTKPENKDTIQKLVDKYNESHDDVTVKVTAPPDAGTVLKTRMAKNDMPDIVAMGGDNNYTEVESAGMLLDLGDQDYIKDVQEAYIDMVYDVNKDKEETIYGVPFATNASGVIYNTEKFEELGLEVPKTWDEFAVFHRLIHTASFIYLFFNKNQPQVIRQCLHIICKFITFILKKAGIFQQNHPTVCKKRHGLTKVDQFLHINVPTLIMIKIHGVIFWI